MGDALVNEKYGALRFSSPSTWIIGCAIIPLGDTFDHGIVGNDGAFVVVGDEQTGSIEVAFSAVVGRVEDVAGQFALHGQHGIGGIDGTVANEVPHQVGEIVYITLDILIDLQVHLVVDFHSVDPFF